MDDDELIVLLKHGSKQQAIFNWWGKTATADEMWELNIVQRWHNSKVPKLKARK